MSPVATVCVVVASLIGVLVAVMLVVGVVEGLQLVDATYGPAVDDDPEQTRRVPVEWAREAVAEKHRRAAAAARVSASFPPPVVCGVAPFVAAGRAGLVERQRVTVALRKGGA